jgi:exodeoxyribonuclease V alpha subunit
MSTFSTAPRRLGSSRVQSRRAAAVEANAPELPFDLPQTPAPAPVKPPAKPAGRLALRSLARDQASEDHVPQAAAAKEQPRQPGLTEITCKVVHEIYRSGDYAVYSARSKEDGDIKISITSSVKAAKGDNIVIRGTWTTYKGSPTFKAAMLMHDIPKGARGIVTWLGTKAAEGVGKETARKLGKYFGDRLPEVVGDAKLLMEAGIPEAKARAVEDAWNNNANQPELIEFLGRHGIGEMTIAKIVKYYGGAARRIVKEDPWALAEKIDGVGFKTADNIAFEAGHDRRSERRIEAGLRCALRQLTSTEGHCGLPPIVLINAAINILGLPESLVAAQMDSVVGRDGVILDEETGKIFPSALFKAENDLTDRLLTLMESGDRMDEASARSAIEAAIDAMGIRRDESQIKAGIMALTSPVSIITGGPGTGKSTIQRAIVNALEATRTVVLVSPTGRAAKRLADVTGRPASTCHRLLSFSAEAGGFLFDRSNPFKENRFIIDEFSMVDLRLGASFMDAVRDDAGVTIVGDIDQLPSVGSGQVLRDLIESGAIPVARLKTVHRQSNDSGIVVAAARINSGQHPIPEDTDPLDGFEFEQVVSTLDIRSRIVELMQTTLPAMGYDAIRDVQVLASMRKGELGVHALNSVIKASLNPGNVSDKTQTVEIKKRVFSVGDRVMHLRNDYTKSVFNGEVGTVVWCGTRRDGNKEEPVFKVDYSGFGAFYGPSDVDDIELSWTATVHKSQGCEFPVVIFVCPTEHRRMLNRNLFYTAVTRAKARCIVIGHENALEHAVKTADTNRRHTGLLTRLRKHALVSNIDAAPSLVGPATNFSREFA